MSVAPVVATEPSNRNGYRSFRLGKFELARDEYFVTVHWPAKGARRSHQMMSHLPDCSAIPAFASSPSPLQRGSPV